MMTDVRFEETLLKKMPFLYYALKLVTCRLVNHYFAHMQTFGPCVSSGVSYYHFLVSWYSTFVVFSLWFE